MQKEVLCKNCGTKFNGNYCPNCSQSAEITRINAHYILHDIPHSILHIDKGLPYTFLQLLKNPGKALLNYLGGQRVRYFKPFAYVIILSAISSVFIKLTAKEVHDDTNNSIHLFFSHYPSILIFALIPIVAFTSWLFFLRKHFNYWEHFIIHTYLAAQINIILVILHLISILGIFGDANMFVKLTLFNFFYMTYHGFTISGLFTNNFKDKFNIKLMLKIGFCCFLLGSIYAFALTYSGVALRWF